MRIETYRLVDVDDVLDAPLEPDLLAVESRHGVPILAALLCPCGCSTWLMLPLQPGTKPSWTLTRTDAGPSLTPSVHLGQGCCAHFELKAGRVIWC